MSNRFKVQFIAGIVTISVVLLTLSLFKPVLLALYFALIVSSLLFIGFLKGKLNNVHYIIILIVSVILSPIIRIPGLAWDIKLDDVWMVFGGLILLIKLATRKFNLKLFFPSYTKIYLLFIFWISLTILFSVFREPDLYSHRDWTEIYKNGKLFLILMICINVKLTFKDKEKIVKIFLLAMAASAMFGVFQFLNLGDINSWLTPHYIFETKLYDLETHRRVVGTFGNPNIFAGALLIAIAFSFSKFFVSFKMKHAAFLLIYFIALTMTLSRTSILLAVVLLVAMSFFILLKSKKRFKSLAYVSLIPIGIVLLLSIAQEEFFMRLGHLRDISTDTSFQARLNMWNYIIETRTKLNIFTGTGPTSNLRFQFDNEWLLILTFYGIIGTGLFLGIFYLIYSKLRKMKFADIGFYNIALMCLMLVFSVYMVVLPVYHLLQLMPVIILLMGITLNDTKEITKESTI